MYDSKIPPGFSTQYLAKNQNEKSMHHQLQGIGEGRQTFKKQTSTPRGRGRPPKQKLDAPSMTPTPPPVVPQPPLVPPPGSCINVPVLIADEEQIDKKIKLNPLSELSPPPKPRLRNECSAPHIHEQSMSVISHVKSVLVFQLTSGSTKSIEAMVKSANNAFSNLDLLGADYSSFYKVVKDFITYHYDFLSAERQKDLQSFPELKTRYEDAIIRATVLEDEIRLTQGHVEMVMKKREPLERQIIEAMELIGRLKQLVAGVERDAESLKDKRQKCVAAHEIAKHELQKLHTQMEAAKDVLREIDQRKIEALNGIESTSRHLKSMQS